MDLDQVVQKEDIERLLPNTKILETSMHSQQGIETVEEEIEKMVYGGKVNQSDSIMVTNVRHKDILVKAEQSLKDALHMTLQKEALEFIEIDVNSAYESLGEIIGETVQEDIINEVFARFCLGK